MSLFPAYADEGSNTRDSPPSDDSKRVTGSSNLPWLQNSSFSFSVSQNPLVSSDEIEQGCVNVSHRTLLCDSSENGTVHSKKLTVINCPKYDIQQKHRRYQTCSTKDDYDQHETRHTSIKSNLFYEDKRGNDFERNVYTESQSFGLWVKPLGYKFKKPVPLEFSQGIKKKKRKKRRGKMQNARYYNSIGNDMCLEKKEQVENSEEEEGTVTSDVKWEGERSKRTAEYNQALSDNPEDVETWLKYSRYQDTIHEYEKLHSKGNTTNRNRLTAERKLAILDKALIHNPNALSLLKERFIIAEEVHPIDKISEQLSKLLEKQQTNLILWQRYIESTQCTLTLCSVSSVMSLYKKALCQLHQCRRKVSADIAKEIEKKIICLLMQLALFLRQAGLWEQFWTLVKMYLELNLHSPSEHREPVNRFNFKSTVSEEEVSSVEDTILKSELPLPVLWLRVEKFREGVHWLACDPNDDCEDPQRLVFPEDVADFIHPLTANTYSFSLVANVLFLFKIPPLPCRHTALSVVKFNSLSWSLDAVEFLLAVYFPISATSFADCDILKDTSELTAGPQYLYKHLGQEHFLKFVIQVFQMCGEHLEEPERTAVYIWWLRFERYLVCLEKYGHCQLPDQRKKRLKSFIKEFLKLERNRNNIIFYREYALLEYELGNENSAFKVLQTAISAQQRQGMSVVSIANENEKSGLCATYRSLCELSHFANLKQRTQGNITLNTQFPMHVLVALVLGIPLSADVTMADVSKEQIELALEKYHHITTELLRNCGSDSVITGMEHLLPDFVVDWISCHAWLIFLSQSVWDSCAFILETITKLPALPYEQGDAHLTLCACRREALYESYVTIIHYHCVKSGGAYSVLREVLHHALQEFPNNLHFLATVAHTELGSGCLGGSWWKLSHKFANTEFILPQIFLIFLAKQKQRKLEEASVLSHKILNKGGPVTPNQSFHNHVSSLFKSFLSKRYTKYCPLLWRMYLQFLFQYGDQTKCRAAFYNGIENCPWAKALYLDAARYVPEELPQIQDLLVEKELRLHVTPEELDILRSDTV